MKSGTRRKVSTPLFLTESYISSSLDSFPIEFLNMQKSYQVVFGEDVLQELVFDKHHLRLQCEKELKGKLLQLRQGFLESGGKSKNLTFIIGNVLLPLLSQFFGHCSISRIKLLLGSSGSIISLVSQEFGIDEQTFVTLLQIKEGTEKLSSKALSSLFENYIREIRKLANTADQLTI